MQILKRLEIISVLMFAAPPSSPAQDVFSFHPLFTEREAILLPEMEGSWEITEFGGDTISFEKTGDNFYEVRISSEGPAFRYEGVFTRLGDRILLDLLPVLTSDLGGSDFRRHLLQVHSCIPLRLEEDSLYIGVLKYRWFYDSVIAKDTSGSYLLSDSRVILTLPTEELRDFLAKPENEPVFPKDYVGLRRIVTPQQSRNEEGQPPAKNPVPSAEKSKPSLHRQDCMPSFPIKDGWLGGDGALAVPLDSSKMLWLFGDTYVGRKDQTTRSGAGMVTTIGVSTCRTDGTMDMQYYWRNMYTDHPDHFFQTHTDRYKFWPFDGFMYRNKLYVLLGKVGGKPGASPDDIFNWTAPGYSLARVIDPGSTPPDQWKIDLFPLSPIFDGVSYDGGFAKDGRYIYLLLVKADSKNYVVRVPLDYIESPDGHLEYFANDGKWKPGTDSADARTVVEDRLVSRIVYHPDSRRWFMVYGPHFGGKVIYYRTAKEITGPWSDRQTLYECPELVEGSPQYDKDNFCYGARVLTQYFDRDRSHLVILYTCNSKELSKLTNDMTNYVPQVVVIPLPK